MISVFKYGAEPPHENAELVLSQMRAAHKYRNRLVEIDLGRRWLSPPQCPCGVSDPQKKCTCEVCRVAIRTREPKDHCGRQDLGYSLVKSLAQREVGRLTGDYIRRARSQCATYWGTYLMVEQAIATAARGFQPPHYSSWCSKPWPRVGVQLQHGLSIEEAFAGTDTRLRVTQAPDNPGRMPGSKRAGRQFFVRLRIGSAGRDPIWTTTRARLHRPLPPGAKIQWAYLQRKKIGLDWRWSVCFVVDWQPESVPADETVAVDIGWRVRPDGSVRVAYWSDSLGKHGPLSLPPEHARDLAHSQSIKSIRDRHFNEFRARLVELLQETEKPEWFSAETATLSRWQSPDRLVSLTHKWRRNRFVGDESAFGEALAWAQKDVHLHQWREHGHTKILARRDDTFRNWAAEMASRYGTLVLENFDLTDVIEAGSPSNSRRHSAAPGIMRTVLVNAFQMRGRHVVLVDPAYTSSDCADCGSREEVSAAEVEHQCACGRVWDRDHNASRNILARASSTETKPITRSAGGANSARQKRYREAKEAANQRTIEALAKTTVTAEDQQ